MILNFSPIRMDARLTVEVRGDRLVLNGESVDPAVGASEWLRAAERVDGRWQVTLLLPHGPDAPAAALFPEPVAVTEDGPVALPGQGAA